MSQLSNKLTSETAAPIFAALGADIRLQLIARLCDGKSQSIVQLTHGTDLSRQGIRKHLTILEHADLIRCERVGRESRFALRSETLNDAIHYLERASHQWDDAIGRLKELLKE